MENIENKILKFGRYLKILLVVYASLIVSGIIFGIYPAYYEIVIAVFTIAYVFWIFHKTKRKLAEKKQ